MVIDHKDGHWIVKTPSERVYSTLHRLQTEQRAGRKAGTQQIK